ncbi:ferredoxin [Amycolatopsis rubida]|uniref:Ferredoxin n=1 Tax=Amycolatopsis rubida TaxID=112413 RepID=A0A1I5S6X2_9PSEU|nr:ferredoxin [Amycolatopsis rubida]SFP66485.1 Ferredoxin [Amycolatopsis rubida]
MKVEIDERRCCSAGQCAVLAPNVFDQREDTGTVVLLTANPPAEHHDAVRDAAESCPGMVITIHEDG